jgi:hypothetical protein
MHSITCYKNILSVQYNEMDDQKIPQKEVSLDNWHGALDRIITSFVSNNPVKWFTFFGVFSLGIIVFDILLALGTLSSITLPETPIAAYVIFSIIPAAFGIIFYMLYRTPIRVSEQIEKLKHIKTFFKVITIVSIILSPIIFIMTGLGHLDCGSSCVSSIGMQDIAANLFYITWIIAPLYFWLKVRKMAKQRIQ